MGKVTFGGWHILRKTSNFFEVLLVKMVVRICIENSVSVRCQTSANLQLWKNICQCPSVNVDIVDSTLVINKIQVS